ncbi:YdiU family protein [Paenibacillus sp. NEAU-GSW1]|uniref:protein adenylyltransferase SelO n=1 Tax=Paenibacillus sp. NEAU-GSW1 TaxID=2682486 RepID=UPI0012E21FCD|nr:YdiU family protein [Paenibacillus sp. NEAU-GSW1]MUT65377.1 YdiU family protein [Paenibacillus sp. NEAU-GSW1]
MNHTKLEGAGWHFDNSYAALPEIFFARQNPVPVRSPKLVRLNHALAQSLGLNAQALETEEGAQVFAGNAIPEGALPLAQAYAGHQFGNFTKLGDGRAMLLGEQLTPSGERIDIAYKGSGRTPYSRGGDGRAALGPMLREYIISEAMHGLGIPTTRSLAVVSTGEAVMRETALPGAVLVRTAASHLRVGTFQYAAQWGMKEDLEALAEYALQRHFPAAEDEDNRYLALLKRVIRAQADLIAKWQLVGFVHGVMNTDNMAVSGETIDYGPCAFMDAYDPSTVFSSIDSNGRYAYGNQPYIGVWNLARFAEALLPILHEDDEEAVKLAEDALAEFSGLFQQSWLTGMRAKLGIFNVEPEDEAFIGGLLGLLHQHHADYTNTFIALSFDRETETQLEQAPEFADWRERWKARLGRQPQSMEQSQQLMRASNPAVIPRNHRVEEALAAAVQQGDYSVMDRLLEALANPYAHASGHAEFAVLPEPPDLPYRTFCGT